MEPLRPLDTTPLFAPLHEALLDLLRSLDDQDWNRSTVAGRWRVRDVAAHLLDGQLRALSALRDGHLVPPETPIRGYRDLVAFLNQLNADWVRAAERLSPRVLMDWLALSGPQVVALYRSLPLQEPALFSVAWAGEEMSKNWMHLGREYTEWWHHQMQIRDAVGAPPILLEEKWLAPLLDISVRVLPHTYRALEAPARTALVLTVEGARWSLVREEAAWRVFAGAAEGAATTVVLDADTAWRLLFHALTPEDAEARARVEGDSALAQPLFRARSVMV